MPSAPKRPCSAPGCGVLVERGACAQHRRDHERQRGSAATRGYDAAHRAWRVRILALDPMCRGCQSAPSTHAEHVVPWQQGGEKYSEQNGQGCCAGCANFKSQREQHDPTFGTRLRAAGAAGPREEVIDAFTGATAWRVPPAPLGWRTLPLFGGTQ